VITYATTLAAAARDDDMLVMHKQALQLFSRLSAVLAGSARAQIYPPGGINNQPVIPFPTAPPRPTAADCGAAGSADEFAAAVRLAEHQARPRHAGHATGTCPPRERRRSFSDRVARCLDDGAAWGMNPNQRAAYSRQCPISRHGPEWAPVGHVSANARTVR
jgi:hypothetical protein